MALNPKQFPSEIATVKRSEITLCDYNPRTIDDEGRKLLKRSLKKFGVLGGIIVNRRNHEDFAASPDRNVVCSGNQKVAVLDAVNKYDPETPESEYDLRVELVDVDAKTEKEIVVAMNNPNIGGDWDYDLLRELIPDIDYKNVGFSEADLSMIGVDYMFQSDDELGVSAELDELMRPDTEAHEAELEIRREERAEQRRLLSLDDEPTREDKIKAVKDMKEQIKQEAIEKASDMDAYFMVTFDKWQDKAGFLAQWGYDPQSKFIKGEDFAARLEGVDYDDEE